MRNMRNGKWKMENEPFDSMTNPKVVALNLQPLRCYTYCAIQSVEGKSAPGQGVNHGRHHTIHNNLPVLRI